MRFCMIIVVVNNCMGLFLAKLLYARARRFVMLLVARCSLLKDSFSVFYLRSVFDVHSFGEKAPNSMPALF